MSHDFDDMLNFNVVDFAKQILTMNSKLISQAMEVERLRGFEKKYNDLMNDSLKHSQTMVGNTIKMLLVPGVTEAFAKNAKAENFAMSENREVHDSQLTGQLPQVSDHNVQALAVHHLKPEQEGGIPVGQVHAFVGGSSTGTTKVLESQQEVEDQRYAEGLAEIIHPSLEEDHIVSDVQGGTLTIHDGDCPTIDQVLCTKDIPL